MNRKYVLTTVQGFGNLLDAVRFQVEDVYLDVGIQLSQQFANVLNVAVNENDIPAEVPMGSIPGNVVVCNASQFRCNVIAISASSDVDSHVLCRFQGSRIKQNARFQHPH